MNKKRILITGATGLVGSSLLNDLHEEYDPFALVRTKPTDYYNNVTYFEFNFEGGPLPINLPNEMDIIIHLAQSNHMRDFPSHAVDIFNVNVDFTAKLLDYGQKSGTTHFIFTSTGGIYGSSLEPCREDLAIQLPQGPLGYYFSTKYAAENLVKAYSSLMSVHILRPFFIYGKNQKNDMFIPRLIENIKKENEITLQGENGILVNPVHVSDVVKLIKAGLLINESLTINVSGPNILSIREISEIIGKQIRK